MAIVFPTTLDTLTNPAKTDKVNSPSHADQHANANDAIEALEAKVGVDGSAVATSHDYKLSEVTSTDKAVSKTTQQTLTNKTLTSPLLTTPKIDDTDAGITITSANQTHTAPTATIPDIVDAADEFVMKDTSQVLTGKTLTTPTIGSFVNAGHNHKDAAGGGKIDEGAITLNDVTTLDVSTSTHGLVPKAPNTGNQFLKDTGAWASISGIGELTIEANQGNEALSIRDCVYVEDGQGVTTDLTLAVTQTSDNTSAGAPYFNGDASGDSVGMRQSFQLSYKTAVKSITLKVGIGASANWSFYYRLSADNAGVPGTTLGDTAGQTGTGKFAETEKTQEFATPVVLEANTTYWISLRGNTDSTYRIPYCRYQNTDVYAGGQMDYTIDGGTNWTTNAGDAYMKINTVFVSNAGNIKKADANAAGLYATTIGFSTDNYAIPDGNADIDSYIVTVQTDGVIGGFTGLTPGVVYYLQDTPGAIGTSPGTNSVKVGIAVSTTELLIRIS